MVVVAWVTLGSMAHAGPAQAALKTSAVLPAKVLAPGEPIWIDLRLRNRTRDTLYFPDFASDACWVDKYAEITLDPPRELLLPPQDCKGDAVRVPPEDTFHRKVNLTALYGLPADTLHAVSVTWKDGGADVYSPTSIRVGPVKYATPFHTGRLLPGDTLFLPNKSSLEFVKFVAQPPLKPGEDELLELEMIHRVPAQGETTQSFKIPYKVRQQFDFGGYTFHIPNHQYGKWIEIRAFQP